MTENYSDSLFEWNSDTVDDGLYFLPGKNGLDCGLTNLQDTLYPFLENEEVSNEDSKFQNLPLEDADTQNVCDVWMNSNVEWLNEISLDVIVAEKGNECNNQDNTIDDDNMVVEHTNSSIHRVECGSIESDDNNSDDCSLTDDQSSLSSAVKSDLDSGIDSKAGSDNNFSDDVLCRMKTKELNMQISGLSDAEKKEIKSRRRTLKNRGYAQNSRSKRTKLTCSLQAKVEKLQSIITKLQCEKNKVAQERDDLKRKLQHMDKK